MVAVIAIFMSVACVGKGFPGVGMALFALGVAMIFLSGGDSGNGPRCAA